MLNLLSQQVKLGFGLLSCGATAICGASAALAIAAALPNHPMKERAILFIALGVFALSSLAMTVYPGFNVIASSLVTFRRLAMVFSRYQSPH
jgi:uncharacterized membrane protein YadS